MKKIYLFMLMFVGFVMATNAQFVNFPDPKFKAALVGNTSINTDFDTEISFVEASAFSGVIFVENDSISSLVGIEAFVNITNLWCDSNQISSLDVSKNVNLSRLGCNFNNLTSLTLNSNLIQLNCVNNKLPFLDVSQNVNLIYLWCANNQLTNLDVSKNVNLSRLGCDNNQLSTLDVSKNLKLEEFWCLGNPALNVDIVNNINLTRFGCQNNSQVSLDFKKCTNLTFVVCSNNPLISLDISQNVNLTNLYCDGTLLTDLNLNNTTKLSDLYISGNQIDTIDIGNLSNLNNFNAAGNSFLKIIYVSTTQDTTKSTWYKDVTAQYRIKGALENINTLLNDYYSIENTNNESFLNVLVNDNVVGSENLFMDLQPDTVGVQQNVTTSFGTFRLINQNQLYFLPVKDTVGIAKINYQLVDTAGVSASNQATITVITSSKLKFYSGFSPNGDSKNANFYITNVRPNSIVKLNVYDMNGFAVYSSSNYDNKWEGFDHDGKKLSPSTYYYIVQYQETSNSNFVQYNGFVEIKY